MEENQTSEEIVDEETPTNEPTSETGGDVETTPKEEVDYKVKFSESSREAQRLLEEKKRLEEENKLYKGITDKFMANRDTREDDEIEKLKDVDPIGYELAKTKRDLDETKKMVLKEKEEREFQGFSSSNPLAVKHAEAIRKLGRLEPTSSYSEIWDKYFKSAYEEGAKAQIDKLRKEKEVQPETGKGNISSEFTTELGEEFNKLPVSKRKEAFKKMGL